VVEIAAAVAAVDTAASAAAAGKPIYE
jgi:hypothetical protein